MWKVCCGVLSSAALASAQQYTISTVAGGAPPAVPVAAASASIGQPQRVMVDTAGNVYFTSLNCVFQLSTSGTLTVVAGNSRAGYAGDGGPAAQAQLNAPTGLAIDSYGDIFIGDTGNNRVREITPDGNITTFAGNGTPGYSGDGGPGTQAQLHSPMGVAVDSSGNVYIADSANSSVRWVTLDGNISTFAGDGFANYYGNGGSPNRAEMHSPQDVAVAGGTLYIVDTGNAYIRAVANGVINDVGGSGTVGFAGDGGLATSAAIYSPTAITVDSAGDYYIADTGNDRIRKVDTKGNISTFAGNGTIGFSGDGSTAANAELNQASGVAVDGQGNLYIADTWNNRIRKVTSSGTISTVAGNGAVSYSGDGGPASRIQLNGPAGVGLDSAGNLYISDSRNRVVRVAKQNVVASVGGGSLVFPRGIASDSAGNVYIADQQGNRVERIGTDGTLSNFAGNGTAGYAGDGSAAANAELNAPTAVATDGAGNVYIADFGNNVIRKVGSSGTITTVAGNAFQGYSGDGGPAAQASLRGPQALAADAGGNLYIADAGNNAIRKVTPDGNIRTIAGNGSAGFSGDGGPASSAQITNPAGLTVDELGDLFFIDGTSRVRQINTSGTIATIAGNGITGYTGDAGIATQAELNAPAALALDGLGNLYIADTGNNAIRMLQPVGSGITVSAVTNAATNQAGPIAPGEVVVLYGSGLGPSQLQVYQLGANGLVPTSVGGVTVLFGGAAAPVLYASPGQTSVVVPFEISGSTAQVVVASQGHISTPVTVPIAPAAPGLFTVDASGKGQAAALNQNQQANSAAAPAARGSLLSLFATGGGTTSPPSTDGLPGAAPLPQLTLPVTVTIGGQPAQVSYAGGAPGQVAGIVEITVQVPSNIQPGNAAPVTLQIGSVTAPAGVTVAIQ
ncbi:MAG: hypothetical protein JO323_00050 [Acidobacteriia bacterium]|nr:hypothetical protein [Terriglobia bacterium]